MQEPANFVVSITPDEKVLPLRCAEKLDLKFLQDAVGGYIEPVSCLLPGYILLADEEGVLKSRPLNIKASALNAAFPSTLLVGTVVVVRVDGEDFIPLNPEQKDFVVNTVNDIKFSKRKEKNDATLL